MTCRERQRDVCDIQRERERQRERDRERDRQTDRQTDRQSGITKQYCHRNTEVSYSSELLQNIVLLERLHTNTTTKTW